MKRFNTTGPCVPNLHYMADRSGKLAQITPMIEQGLYFTINRGRQYGKTTMLGAIRRKLDGEYTVIKISFENIDPKSYENTESFSHCFMRLVQDVLEFSACADDSNYIESWYDKDITGFESLSKHIRKMCKGRKVVLLIDEVDASLNYNLYIRFLAMLRDKYIRRSEGTDITFHSVILAGVHDIKNVKTKMIATGVYTPSPKETGTYNSPWNIAANFDVDMSLSAAEIGTMLAEYEADHRTGMDVGALSGEIRDWTGGYPFLVSRICQIIDENPNKDWTLSGVEAAVKALMGESNTLFDDLFKNLERYPGLYQYMYDLLIVGDLKKESGDDPVVSQALMFSFLKSTNGTIKIHNRIFENRIIKYFLSKDSDKTETKDVAGVLKYDVVHDGHFDMELALRKFAKHFRQIFTETDRKFLERNGRMVFLAYLMPLINGQAGEPAGFYQTPGKTAARAKHGWKWTAAGCSKWCCER
jgi:hypothetical protein